VSCPPWRALAAEREASGADPRGWTQALAHLDGCPTCRREAIAADPLLAFRRLPAPAATAAEVETMRQAVAALRRAGRVPAEARPAASSLARLGGLGAVRRAAAAAALVAVGLLLRPAAPERPGAAGGSVAAVPREVEEAAVQASFVEDLDLADARVYQLDASGMQVVMIVHPSLDL
jgi:hypothetical protein